MSKQRHACQAQAVSSEEERDEVGKPSDHSAQSNSDVVGSVLARHLLTSKVAVDQAAHLKEEIADCSSLNGTPAKQISPKIEDSMCVSVTQGCELLLQNYISLSLFLSLPIKLIT